MPDNDGHDPTAERFAGRHGDTRTTAARDGGLRAGRRRHFNWVMRGVPRVRGRRRHVGLLLAAGAEGDAVAHGRSSTPNLHRRQARRARLHAERPPAGVRRGRERNAARSRPGRFWRTHSRASVILAGEWRPRPRGTDTEAERRPRAPTQRENRRIRDSSIRRRRADVSYTTCVSAPARAFVSKNSPPRRHAERGASTGAMPLASDARPRRRPGGAWARFGGARRWCKQRPRAGETRDRRCVFRGLLPQPRLGRLPHPQPTSTSGRGRPTGGRGRSAGANPALHVDRRDVDGVDDAPSDHREGPARCDERRPRVRGVGGGDGARTRHGDSRVDERRVRARFVSGHEVDQSLESEMANSAEGLEEMPDASSFRAASRTRWGAFIESSSGGSARAPGPPRRRPRRLKSAA